MDMKTNLWLKYDQMIFDCRPDVRLRPSMSERVNDVTVNGTKKRIVKMRRSLREERSWGGIRS
jgi:hypothetical protein